MGSKVKEKGGCPVGKDKGKKRGGGGCTTGKGKGGPFFKSFSTTVLNDKVESLGFIHTCVCMGEGNDLGGLKDGEELWRR